MHTQTTTDEKLMLDVKNGDLDALAPLFEKYNVQLYNFFLRLCKCKATSEDLTQNVFQRIIKYRNSFKTHSRFRPWVYQIARNELASHFRGHPQKAEFEKVEDIPEEETELTAVQDKTLFHALKQLSKEEQQIIELSRFQGLKYKEISAIIGNSESAVKVKVHRAIQKLRKHYFATI